MLYDLQWKRQTDSPLSLPSDQLLVIVMHPIPNYKGETLFLFRQNLVSAKIGLV